MYHISEFIFYFNLGVSFYKSLGMVLFCEKHRTQRTSGGQPVGRSSWEIELRVCIWAAGLKKKKKNVETPREYLLLIWVTARFSDSAKRGFNVFAYERPKVVCGVLSPPPLTRPWLGRFGAPCDCPVLPSPWCHCHSQPPSSSSVPATCHHQWLNFRQARAFCVNTFLSKCWHEIGSRRPSAGMRGPSLERGWMVTDSGFCGPWFWLQLFNSAAVAQKSPWDVM